MTTLRTQYKNESHKLFLMENGYLSEFNWKECKELLCLMEQQQVKAGQPIFEEGEHGDQIFIIRQGDVILGHTKTHHAWVDFGPYGSVDFGEDCPLPKDWSDRTTLHPGDCVGEETFTLDARHQLTAQAESDVQLLVLDAARVNIMAAKNPKVRQCIAQALKRSLGKVDISARVLGIRRLFPKAGVHQWR